MANKYAGNRRRTYDNERQWRQDEAELRRLIKRLCS